ncbi:histidine phosphatase family protein [Croceicoccus ponticola]|uniref:Histidine phosphatase family protein n=1 Tax=Croceicoccus ponticola TaxID=2217664 RepID=A0A437GV09_9SPHN|nr:histidine phosphatase family protein [Croceicoccus ponticola]RVQ65506.1 histidine phosphatase family protein [Croceicoccus ponticola]
MKRLGLLRHAKSEEDQSSGYDFDRELSAKGRRAAEAMGRHIGKKVAPFDRILASPARRAQETLNIALDAMGKAAPVDRIEDRRLYLATSDSIDEVVAQLGGDADSILLVAHNPGLEDVVLDHVPNDGSSRLRDIVAVKYPTGAFAILEFDIDDWSSIGGATARLISLTRPRDIDPTLGPEIAR